MSCEENTRVTDAIARSTGKRWCSSCQMDRAADGFRKINSRWFCSDCQTRKRKGIPPHPLFGRAR